MNIDTMSLDEIKFELNRARFWVEDSPITQSLDLIQRMENQKMKLIKEKLK
jgi:hypothetical protein